MLKKLFTGVFVFLLSLIATASVAASGGGATVQLPAGLAAVKGSEVRVRPGIYSTAYPGCLIRVETFENTAQLRPLFIPDGNYRCNLDYNSESSFGQKYPPYKQDYTCNSSGVCVSEVIRQAIYDLWWVTFQDSFRFKTNGTIEWSRKVLSDNASSLKEYEISTSYYFRSSKLAPFMIESYGVAEFTDLTQKENCVFAKKAGIEDAILKCHEYYLFPKCTAHHTVSKPGSGVKCQVNAFVWGSH